MASARHSFRPACILLASSCSVSPRRRTNHGTPWRHPVSNPSGRPAPSRTTTAPGPATMKSSFWRPGAGTVAYVTCTSGCFVPEDAADRSARGHALGARFEVAPDHHRERLVSGFLVELGKVPGKIVGDAE